MDKRWTPPAHVAAEVAAGEKAFFDARVIPSGAYTDPEVAWVALDIGKTIHPPPTLGESIGMAAEVAHGTCTDIPASKKAGS